MKVRSTVESTVFSETEGVGLEGLVLPTRGSVVPQLGSEAKVTFISWAQGVLLRKILKKNHSQFRAR